MVLVVLVIMGHIIEPLIEEPLCKSLYLFIYLFHMPLFVGISGFLTSESLSSRKLLNHFSSLVIPLAVFTFLYELYEVITTGHLSKYLLVIVPHWILWYLYSLICWRLLFPLVSRWRFPVVITLFVALIAGTVPQVGYGLGLSRTLYFFPFFLVGNMVRKGGVVNWWPKGKLFNVLVLLGVILLVSFNKEINEEWFYGSYGYGHFSLEWWRGVGFRLMTYLLSFGISLSIAALVKHVPNRESALTRRGRSTLYAYIWHGFIIKLLVDSSAIPLIGTLNPLAGIVICAATALFSALLLTSGFVKRVTKKLLFSPVEKGVERVRALLFQRNSSF